MTTRGHRPNITTSGRELSCLTTRSKYGLRGLLINIQRQLFRDVPSCHLGTPDYSSTSTKNPPSRSVKSSSETKQTTLSSTNSQDYI